MIKYGVAGRIRIWVGAQRFWSVLRLTGLLFTAVAAFSACGGSSSSGDFVGAAVVTISASPSSIDTGDRSRVTTNIWNVHPDGIMLKFFYPFGLDFIPGSAALTISGQERALTPDVNTRGANGIYLVFFLAQSLFGEDGNNTGILDFQLRGGAPVSGGRIEVDADVDDILIDNEREFDVNNPEFTAEASTSIEVRG